MKQLLVAHSTPAWVYLARLLLRIPIHLAVIPNGNRRWARILAFIRCVVAGQYSKGAYQSELEKAYRDVYVHGANQGLKVVSWAEAVGARHVTFYGLSEENKAKRKEWEIDALMEGAVHFFDTAVARGYHLHPFGDIEAFAGVKKYAPLYDRLKMWKAMPIPEDRIIVHVAAHYSGSLKHELAPFREAIAEHGIDEVLANPRAYVRSAGVPDIDLVIRTGSWRESRTSGLLPAQVGYAELYFMWIYWALLTKANFIVALCWYTRKKRNFGR